MTTPAPPRRPVVGIANADAPVMAGFIAAIGDGGFSTVVEGSLAEWASRHRHSLALLVVRHAGDWQRLARLVADEARVVVVLPQLVALPCRRAMVAGATAVVALDGSADDVVAALRAARRGHVLMPAALLRRVLAPTCETLPPPDRDLLEQLATPRTVAEIARDTGCSERTLYRHVQRLYARMQVSGRREAVAVWHDTHAAAAVAV